MQSSTKSSSNIDTLNSLSHYLYSFCQATNFPILIYVKFRASFRRVATVVLPVPGVPVTKIFGIVLFGIIGFYQSISIIFFVIVDRYYNAIALKLTNKVFAENQNPQINLKSLGDNKSFKSKQISFIIQHRLKNVVFFLQNLFNKMSSVEINEQGEHKKLPLPRWDKQNLKSTFQSTSMDIFHINEVRLIDLQSQLNSSKITLKPKQIAVKIYTIFEDMNIIFQRLGLSELYHQLRLILNMICKFSLFSEQNKKKEQFKLKKQEKNPDESLKSIQKSTPSQKDCYRLKLKKKYNRLAGIFLYNQSYIRTIQRAKKVQERCKREITNIRQLLDPEDKNQQLQRMQMIYYLDRKKELTVLKIKDNTKKYQEIQDDFRGVQLKLKQMVDNLQLQFQSQYQKTYNYLSKEQINAQLISFNMNMRSQVVLLKQQCNNVAQSLRQQNIQLKNQLDQWIFRKNSMVSAKVQTVQTISTLNKTKKMAQDYERKINLLQNKIEDCLKKNDQIQQNFNNFAVKKNKQLAYAEECLNNKQQVIQTLRNKCQNFSQIINSQSNIIKNLQFSDEQLKQKTIDELTQKLLDQQQQNIQKKPRNRNSFLSRLGQRSPIRALSKYSRFSASTQQFDQVADKIQNSNQQMVKNEKKQNFQDKNQQKIVEKKYSESVWRKNNYKFLNTFSKRNRRSVIVKNRLDRRFDNREIQTLKNNFNYGSSLNTSHERGVFRNKNTAESGINKKSERGSQKNSHNSSFRNDISHLQIKQRNKNKNKDSESTRRRDNNNKQQLKECKDKDTFLVSAEGKMKKYSSFPCNLIQNEASQSSDKEIKKLKSVKKIDKRFNQCRQGINIQKQIKNTIQKKKKKTKFLQNNDITKVSIKNLKSTKQIFTKSSKKIVFNSNQENYILQQNIINESQKQNGRVKKLKKEEEVLQQLLNHNYLTMNSFKQILNDYPKIYQKLISQKKNQKLIKSITQTHTLTCKEKSCNHLQAFFQFCKKLAEEPSRRKVLNVHIQKF